MSTATYVIGDTREVVAAMPDGCIDLVLTSPPIEPFLALRSYLPSDHPHKGREIGAEPTPAEFVSTLLALTAEWGRVLAPHGSICVELGDTYSGSGGGGGDYLPGGMRDGQQQFAGSAASMRESNAAHWRQKNAQRDAWPMDKCLTLIPELYRVALAYGIHPLTGEPSPAGRWRVRNVVRWVRPNPPVGALGDKFRPATSDVVVMTRSRTRWFDLDAVRVPADPANKRPSALTRTGIDGRTDQVCNPVGEDGQRIISNPAGAPPLDWWSISPGGYTGAHFAVFPAELCIKPIKAMCPLEVCRTCGEPRRRITETEQRDTGRTTNGPKNVGRKHETAVGYATRTESVTTTLGFTDCSHGDYRPGRVLDPFGGSGTTGLVASGHGRDSVLIDLDERNLELARQRVGMFLTEATPADLPALLGTPAGAGT